MDKMKSSVFGEIVSGYKNYIFYSIKDFKDDFNLIKQGRNGFIGYSKHKVNLTFNPFQTQNFQGYNRTHFFEDITNFVDISEKNLTLRDRSLDELVVDCDLTWFVNSVIASPRYQSLVNQNKDKVFDALFDIGFDLKPILMYDKKESSSIKLLGFCDDENLQVEENSNSLENVLNLFKRKQFE